MSSSIKEQDAVTVATGITGLSDFTSKELSELKPHGRIIKNGYTFINTQFLGLWAWENK